MRRPDDERFLSMTRTLSDSIVVITGASSGIGRATALKVASEGATVAVASRRADALDRLVAEIERAGGKAIAYPVDVSDEAAVLGIAKSVVETCGRIDVWVNNASVMSFGQFLDTPSEDFRRIFEVNVFGYAYGARAALPVFLEQGYGTLVNVGSVVSRAPQAESLPYVASKHAVRAISMSLRQELLLRDARDIHVVTVLPAAIDTPLFGHAANYTGKAVRPPRPVYTPEMVADIIVDGIRNPRNEIYAGGMGRMANVSMKLAPGLTERLAILMAGEQTLEDRPVPPTPGNFYTPSQGDDEVRGGWLSESDLRKRSAGKAGLATAGTAVALRLVRSLIGRR
jgi:short-subunit dehydrogenase